jgi:hypothetical protein
MFIKIPNFLSINLIITKKQYKNRKPLNPSLINFDFNGNSFILLYFFFCKRFERSFLELREGKHFSLERLKLFL